VCADARNDGSIADDASVSIQHLLTYASIRHRSGLTFLSSKLSALTMWRRLYHFRSQPETYDAVKNTAQRRFIHSAVIWRRTNAKLKVFTRGATQYQRRRFTRRRRRRHRRPWSRVVRSSRTSSRSITVACAPIGVSAPVTARSIDVTRSDNV
jgi:hypothetical protein